MCKYIIYALIDPITDKIRYIGKSTSGLERPKSHFTKKHELNKTTRKANWIKSLLKQNLKPTIVILGSYDSPEILNEEEIKFIKYYRELGEDLCNHTDGGEGTLGRITSEQTKALIREKRKGWTTGEPWNKRKHIIENNVEKRQCNYCHTFKPILDYPSNRSNKNGYHQRCKPCHSKYIKELRKSNPEMCKKENKDIASKRKFVRENIIHYLPHKCSCEKTYKDSILINDNNELKNISSILSINLKKTIDSLTNYKVICKNCI